MNTTDTHTPLPWVVDFGGTAGHIKSVGVPQPEGQDWKSTPTVARYDESVTAHSLTDEERQANAAFIVEACNNYERLIESEERKDREIEAMVDALEMAQTLLEVDKDDPEGVNWEANGLLPKIRAALRSRV